jgi:cell division protein FtsN
MIIKRKILFTVITLITTCIINFAQAPNTNWIPVIELPNQSVFIDTSIIKYVENQISVLSLTSYKKPQLITSIGLEASNVKSQILFNVPLNKYTIIGALYYDKNLKILGETTLPGFAKNNQNFALSVDSNAVMAAILDKSQSVLNKDNIGSTAGKNSKSDSKNKTGSVLTDKKELLKTNQDKIDQKPPAIKIPIVAKSNDNNQKLPVQIPLRKDQLVKKDQSIKIVRDSSSKKEEQKKPILEKRKEEIKSTPVPKVKEAAVEKPYNSQKESNPKSTIFTDGTKYSFQVSSWKNKSKAESEVQKLKSRHHNAFIAEGIVKGVTRYRVRIGYFRSLEETETYMLKLK